MSNTIATEPTTGTFDGEFKRDPNAFPLGDSDRLLVAMIHARPEHAAFLKAQIGIQDDEEFKSHILSIQEEAYKVFPYQCIRWFGFAADKISFIPQYDQFVKLGEREDAILLDLGCCFGTDVRRVVRDGWPVERIVASDIHPQFWELGHKLFRSTPASFPVTFIPGNALTDAHLAEHPVLPTSPSPTVPAPLPDLRTLTSLNPLAGRLTAIYCGALFHLFPAEGQARLARALAGLLAPVRGATIAGLHSAGRDGTEGVHAVMRGNGGEGGDSDNVITQYWHSPRTWTALWDGEIFPQGTVRVQIELAEHAKEIAQISALTGVEIGKEWVADSHTLRWSVTRV